MVVGRTPHSHAAAAVYIYIYVYICTVRELNAIFCIPPPSLSLFPQPRRPCTPRENTLLAETPHFFSRLLYSCPPEKKQKKASNVDDAGYMETFDNRDGEAIFRSPIGSVMGRSPINSRQESNDTASPPFSPAGRGPGKEETKG